MVAPTGLLSKNILVCKPERKWGLHCWKRKAGNVSSYQTFYLHIIWFSDFYFTQLSNYEANHVKYLLTLNSIDNLIIREPIRLNIALLNRTFSHQKINLLLENNVVVHFF